MPLGKNADAGDYIKDFEKSKAPQFKGKSKEKRRKMAIAAYLDSKDKKESKMKSFDDIRAELNEAKFKVEIDGGIETVDARSEKEAIRKAARKQGNSKSVGKSFGPKVKVTKISEEDQVQEISSNKLGDYMRKSAADAAKRGPGQSARRQDKRIAGQSMADKKIRKKMGYSSDAKVPAGKNESVDEKKMDSAAMKKAMDAYKKRGGKITKVAPGKAAGYHGKDDPGKGMAGMMDKGDTKNMPKKRFMRSMK